MDLFKQEFQDRKQAEKIRKSISNKNTTFDKIRQRMLKEITNS